MDQVKLFKTQLENQYSGEEVVYELNENGTFSTIENNTWTLKDKKILKKALQKENSWNTFNKNLDACKTNPKVISGKYEGQKGFFGQVYTDKDFKKALIHSIGCKNPLCDVQACMSLRKKEAHIDLKAYFEFHRKNHEKVSHGVFGFPRLTIDQITPDFITKMRIALQKSRKEIIGNKKIIKVLGVMDLSYGESDKTFYFHWHLAIFFPSWHRGNLKYLEIRKISEKYGFTFTRFENKNKADRLFKNPVRILDYISKRSAGILEHPSLDDGSYSKYSDWFSRGQFFNLFYRQKRFFSWGYSKKQRDFIQSQAREEFLSCIIGNNQCFFTKEFGKIYRKDIVFFVEPSSNYSIPPYPPDIIKITEKTSPEWLKLVVERM